jgi:small GTP-binding protein
MANRLIALAGNPNAGKSTVFNALTGARQHVGNWPGKTVEKKEGIFKHNGEEIAVVDLPGTYSLSAYSLEEQIARDFIVEQRPDMVVNVVDSANLERNLYLTMQVLETGIPVVLVLNMIDIAESRQMSIDTAQLSAMLHGIPVIPMVASSGKGLEQLKQTLAVAPTVATHETEAALVAERSEP